MDCIILTKEQADSVKGKYGKYDELQPIPITDGSFVLPHDVLYDEAFVSVKEQLSALPIREVLEVEFLIDGIEK